MTNLREIVKRLLDLAPREATIQGLEARMEIGPQTESEQGGTTVKRVLVATYPSARVVTKASQDRSNLVVTYRPLFPYAIDRLSGLDLVRVRLLVKNYISSYVVGSGWLSADGGLNDALVESLGLTKVRNFEASSDYGQWVAVGRVCLPPGSRNHSGFVNYVAEKLGLDSITFTGDLDEDVKETLVIAGSHVDMPEIINAKKQDIGTLVTGEISPEVRLMAQEEGLNILELGAFVTEEPGMETLRNVLSLEFPELNIDFIESKPVTKTLRPYSKDMA
ncbi:MAG: Nif3-like dinuclear metal center hexameric protein [Candidatus Thorarchaeota archaeon]